MGDEVNLGAAQLDGESESRRKQEGAETRCERLYAEGLRYLQRGEWNKAIAGLEELLSLCPEHRQAAALLDEARLKASLDRAKPTAKRVRPRRLLRGLALVLMCIVIGLALVTGAVWVRSQRLQPSRASQQEVTSKVEQLAEAQTYLAEQEYAAAREAFEALLAQAPGDEQAKAGLAQVEEELALAETYDQAKDAVARQDWDEAWRLLEELSAVNADYRDVRQQRALVQQQQQLNASFKTAEDAYQQGDWTQAMTAYESLMDLDPGFQRQAVTDHLAEACLWQGRGLIDQTQGATHAVREALALFRKGLVLKPQHPQLVQEVAVAEKYLEAQAMLDQGDVDGAVAALEWVETQRPLYAGGNVIALLRDAGVEVMDDPAPSVTEASEPAAAEAVGQGQYAALVRQGDEAKAAGDHSQAEQYYRQAMAIGIRWSLTPYVRMAALRAELGDYQLAVGTMRTTFLLLRDSDTTMRSASFWEHIEQGDRYAQNGDYVKALEQYDKALLILAQECDCGLENWKVLP